MPLLNIFLSLFQNSIIWWEVSIDCILHLFAKFMAEMKIRKQSTGWKVSKYTYDFSTDNFKKSQSQLKTCDMKTQFHQNIKCMHW